jgi:hypothetical protein
VTLGGTGNGFEVTVPADTVSRGLKVYLGLSQAGGKLEATLSDGSATPIVDTSLVNNVGTSNYVYSLNFRAASNGQTLTVRWTANSVVGGGSFVSLQAATLGDLYECDVAPRPLGSRNGIVNNTDVIQLRQFISTGPPGPLYLNNEFQRADCSGLLARGNNLVNNSDVIQARRFLQGLDAVPTAAGPSPSGLWEGLRPSQQASISTSGKQAQLAPDDLTLTRVSLGGGKVQVGVNYQSVGDAVGAAFALTWNPSKLTAPTWGLGSGSGTWNIGTATASSGQLNVTLESNGNESDKLPAGTRQIFWVEFTITTSDPSTQVGYASSPAPLITVLVGGSIDERTPNTFPATISLQAPTAAGVSVSGRIADNSGRGISRVLVTMTNAIGERKTAHTNTFGYYRFDDVRAGAAYTVSAMSKRYTFDPPVRVISVFDDVTDLDFLGSD